MKDAKCVITEATKGIVDKLADRRGITYRRMSEILGPDNPYPKAKWLITDIAEFNSHGVRLIKADVDALFDSLLGKEPCEDVTDADLNREAFEAIDAVLRGKCAADQLRELRELVAVCEKKISAIEKLQARGHLSPVA
jgi:hypothetical protein